MNIHKILPDGLCEYETSSLKRFKELTGFEIPQSEIETIEFQVECGCPYLLTIERPIEQDVQYIVIP